MTRVLIIGTNLRVKLSYEIVSLEFVMMPLGNALISIMKRPRHVNENERCTSVCLVELFSMYFFTV